MSALKEVYIYNNNNNLLTFAYNEAMKLEYIIEEAINSQVESIYIAKINTINKKNGTAFINYETTDVGLLNLKHNNKLQNGSKLLCQMNWRGDDNKLAKLTQQIKFVGKYIILLGKNNNLKTSHSFSKKMHITPPQLIDISNKYTDYQIIFRSNCNNLHESNYQLIEDEIQLLTQNYDTCLREINSGKFGLIISGCNDYLRLIRNQKLDIALKIITNCTHVFETLQNYRYLWQIHDIQLCENTTPSIKQTHDYANTHDNIKIQANNGSNIVCHKLSGINVIDVNSDKASQDFYMINYLLCDNIAYAIKLKDLTGIILIDFIKNMTQHQQTQIIDRLSCSLIEDWRKSNILGFTNAGICEIIRAK